MDHLGFVLRETDDWTNQDSFIGDQSGSFLREADDSYIGFGSS